MNLEETTVEGQDRHQRLSCASVSGEPVKAAFASSPACAATVAAGRHLDERQRGDAASQGGVQDRHFVSDR